MDFKSQKEALVALLELIRDFLKTSHEGLERTLYIRFAKAFEPLVLESVVQAIRSLEAIGDEKNDKWTELRSLGLTDASLRMKIEELSHWISVGDIKNFIEGIDSVLESLIKAFSVLEPVKEFKDFLKLRLGIASEPQETAPEEKSLEEHLRDMRQALFGDE